MNISLTKEFIRELQSIVRGQVKLDQTSRYLYSTDASSYQIMPAGVVLPRDADDVSATIEIAARYGLSIVPRGAGTMCPSFRVTRDEAHSTRGPGQRLTGGYDRPAWAGRTGQQGPAPGA